MFTRPLVVLMTATLNPGPYANAVQRADPRLRTEDYLHALEFWARITDQRIKGVVFCENSGGELTLLKTRLAESATNLPIEWLTFGGNSRPVGMHYGYSELGHLEYAVTNSHLLAGTNIFLKVTGRLIFPEISKLLDTFDQDIRFAVDCRRAYRRETGSPIKARTQLMMIEKNFYFDHFFGRSEEMLRCCSHLEEFVALRVLPFRNDPTVVLRFKRECPPVGIAAFTGENYHTGKTLLKSKLRQILRRVAPGVWL